MPLWQPTAGGFVHCKKNYDPWNTETRIRVAQQYAAYAQKIGGVAVNCDMLSQYLPSGIYSQTYDAMRIRLYDWPNWWAPSGAPGLQYFKRGYHASFADPGQDPDPEIDWSVAASWQAICMGPSSGNIWHGMDSGYDQGWLCVESRECIKRNVRRIIGLQNWANSPASLNGQGQKKYDLVIDLWFPCVDAWEVAWYGFPSAFPLNGGPGDYWCGRAESPLHGTGGHNVRSINGIHRVRIGYVVFWSLLIQVAHAYEYSIAAGLWEWNSNQIRDILDGCPDFDAVHGQGGSDPISLRLYVNPRGAPSGSWQTFYPSRMFAVPDTCWQELSLLRGAWQRCGEAGFFNQPAGTWNDVAHWRSLVETYRPDIAAAYHPSQYVRFSLGSTLPGEQGGYCWEYPAAYIASGAIAAKYRCSCLIHHIGAQDHGNSLFGNPVGEHSLGAELAVRISHWDDRAGIADADRTLSPADPATWTGCQSLQYYRSVRRDWPTAGREVPWSEITQGVVGTHYWDDPWMLWVAWTDLNARWDLGPGVSIDPTRGVELVIVPRSGDDANMYTWQSRVTETGAETPGNDAGRGHVSIDQTTHELHLTQAGKNFGAGAMAGRVGYKIPILIEGYGNDPNEDTMPPTWYDFIPWDGQPNFPFYGAFAAKVRDAGTGVNRDTVSATCDGLACDIAHIYDLGFCLLVQSEYPGPWGHGPVPEGHHVLVWSAADNAGNVGTATIEFWVQSAPGGTYPPPPRNFRLVSLVWDRVAQCGRAYLAWDPPESDDVSIDGYFILHRTTPWEYLPAHELPSIPSVGEEVPPDSGNVCAWVGTQYQTSCTLDNQPAGMNYVTAYSYSQQTT